MDAQGKAQMNSKKMAFLQDLSFMISPYPFLR